MTTESEIFEQASALDKDADQHYAKSRARYQDRDILIWDYLKEQGIKLPPPIEIFNADRTELIRVRFDPKIEGPMVDKRRRPK